METGVNARAVDFAKFGQLFLAGGNWNGKKVISDDWVSESTRPNLPNLYESYYPEYFSAFPGKAYYSYMWWGMTRQEGGYDFFAEGDKGQFIYISPAKSLVIIRNGMNWGIPSHDWLALFYEFASEF